MLLDANGRSLSATYMQYFLPYVSLPLQLASRLEILLCSSAAVRASTIHAGYLGPISAGSVPRETRRTDARQGADKRFEAMKKEE